MPPTDMETSSGLIMNVIRILTNSKDDAERDVIKKKLEDCLVVSDQKLTKLVSEHHKDLRLVMQAFTSVSNNLQTSLTKLTKAKLRLVDSREMLTSKIEELKKLSDESKVNERIIALLDQETLKDEARESPEPQINMAELDPELELTPTSVPSLFRFSLSSHGKCFNEYYKSKPQ